MALCVEVCRGDVGASACRPVRLAAYRLRPRMAAAPRRALHHFHGVAQVGQLRLQLRDQAGEVGDRLLHGAQIVGHWSMRAPNRPPGPPLCFPGPAYSAGSCSGSRPPTCWPCWRRRAPAAPAPAGRANFSSCECCRSLTCSCNMATSRCNSMDFLAGRKAPAQATASRTATRKRRRNICNSPH